jgi:hypothetical protein
MTIPSYIPSDSESAIDYTSDTTETDPNILPSDTYISDVDAKMKKLYKKVGRHPTINNKFNSSSESLKKYIDVKTFENISKQNATTFYSMEKLETSDFNTIYNIMIQSTYIIFIDNSKMIKKSTNKCFFSPKETPHLIDMEFPGCTFLPFEAISVIKKNLNKLNNSIFNAEVNGNTLYMNDIVCSSVMFHEGEIVKNCLYKKMEVIDMIVFVPIEVYNMKQTEYKLRGFCQIVEELGASNIDITFKTINNTETKKDMNMKIGDDIKLIAGNLGMTSNTTSTNNVNYDYNLTYPKNSTITLNEKMIKNKIKKKKFIVSDAMYNSNLELQYLVHSRCRHLINMYSTVFTFDNTSVIDKTMYSKLKTHGIEISADYKTLNSMKNNIEIITNVTFVTLEQCKDLVNGNNVSLDEIGFNHIMETIKNEDIETFKKNGIYKIMGFINMYISHVIKHSNPQHYKTITKINARIKKELTISEYAELLCNYFNTGSQWIHFTNYIDLLGKKTHSFDKLGYIVIMNSTNVEERFNMMLQFIQELCVEKTIEDKYWKMLQPHNISLKKDLRDKLLNEYDFIKNYNHYNMMMLIYRISIYTVNFNDDNNIRLNQLITNMDVGYTVWEYYNNLLPFIVNHMKGLYYDTKDELYLSTTLEKSFNINNFISAKIGNINDLNQYIDKKFKRLKESYEWLNNITFPMEVNDFLKELEKNHYLMKRFMNIIKIKTILNTKKYLKLSDCKVDKDTAYNMINMLHIYNDKLDIKTVPLNYIGFDMIMNNINCGIGEDEIKIFIDFISKQYTSEEIKYIKEKITYDQFLISCTTYDDTIEYIDKIMEDMYV